MAKPSTAAEATSRLKAFFGASAALQAVRKNLNLSPEEQFLALSLALVSHSGEHNITPERALSLLKKQFKANYADAKTGKAKAKEGTHEQA